MWIVRASLLRRLCVALIALALATAGVGHGHGPAPALPAALAAFLDAGGTVDDLCLEGADHVDVGGDCPWCQREEAVALAAALFSLSPPPRAAEPRPLAEAGTAIGRGPRAPPARGPPTSLA
ncbi:hypothetical protein [Rubrimonas sp.]|uniref:hypothetical protein n=1 Tax=Rubrimonas sp. TaxID=2036015 RepID=UPI002FDDF348